MRRLLLACWLLPFAAHAADRATTLSNTTIPYADGAQIYQHVCQGCHMKGGTGATGAASFPAFAHDPRLAGAAYPIYMVLNGNGGMPWFNGVLSPAQIAAVVTYIRTSFGNNYSTPVTAAAVAAMAGPPPVAER